LTLVVEAKKILSGAQAHFKLSGRIFLDRKSPRADQVSGATA
jgi:hypothetical protein